IDGAFPRAAREARELARFLHQNPEVSLQEFLAAERIGQILEKAGFRVRRGIGGLKTAFRADYGRGENPAVAFLAEYDALPGLGHACGHNLIAGASVGAALALAAALPPGSGNIVVLGTPAEETLGGKIPLLAARAFAGVGAAFLAHPSNQTRVHSKSLALVSLEITFQGRSAHAAASPEKGINALDALIQVFVALGPVRAKLPAGSRIDGVILEGGRAANIVPDRTRASFYLRARNLSILETVRREFEKCVRGAEISTGARGRILRRGFVYAPFLSHPTLGEAFRIFGEETGLKFVPAETRALGSSDIGNVSQAVPCLHPTFAIGSPETAEHSPEFARAAGSERALREMTRVARALAYAGGYLFSRRGFFQLLDREQKILMKNFNLSP
ncbi:MAG: amidohydrolase, partial [Proteobacteria bacterium]|nr:amidohydrolase [Pseudomonadota bacterium]